MRPGRCENPSKIMKNVTRSASGGVSGTSLFQERKNERKLMLFNMIYVKKARFWAPFWNPLDFEGVPKSHFFNINQHKMKKNEALEGVLEKHVFLIRNRCGKVTFREA
jgi:hypothetical protein